MIQKLLQYLKLMIMAKLMQGKLLLIMDICRAFDQIYKEHLDGM